MSLKCVPRCPTDNKPALVQVMAWRRRGDKPLPEPMLTQFIDAYMCGTRGRLTGWFSSWNKRYCSLISTLASWFFIYMTIPVVFNDFEKKFSKVEGETIKRSILFAMKVSYLEKWCVLTQSTGGTLLRRCGAINRNSLIWACSYLVAPPTLHCKCLGSI